MQKELMRLLSNNDHLGCFGRFSISDPICIRFCALSLRCSIEQEQNDRMDFLDDLVSMDNLSNKIQ